MNVRRGLARAWVVVSLTWIVAIGAYIGPTVIEDMQKEDFLQKLHSLTPPKAGLPCEIAEANASSVKWEKISKLRSGGRLFCVAPVSEIKALTPEYQAMAPDDFMTRLDDRARTWIREPLMAAAFVLLLPPIVLLIVGSLIGWIVSGFVDRKEPTAT